VLLFDDVLDVLKSNASISRVGVGVVSKLVFVVSKSNVRVFAVSEECRQLQRARLDVSVCCDVSNHCGSCLKKPTHFEVDDCLGSDWKQSIERQQHRFNRLTSAEHLNIPPSRDIPSNPTNMEGRCQCGQIKFTTPLASPQQLIV
jgi:hypothetical protein